MSASALFLIHKISHNSRDCFHRDGLGSFFFARRTPAKALLLYPHLLLWPLSFSCQSYDANGHEGLPSEHGGRKVSKF